MAEKEENKENGEYKPQFDIVEEGADKPEQDKGADKGADKSGYADDERLSASQREEEDDEHDEPEKVEADKGDETQEEIEAKRERRRRERKAQKARQQQARERDARELHYLRTRNEQLERRFGSLEQRVQGNELQQVEGRLQQLKTARDEADEVLAKAIEAGNGADVVKLQRTIRELEGGISRLTNYKAGLEKAPEDKEGAEEGQEQQEQGQQQRAVRPPPSVIKNVTVFGERHPWFNPKGTDEDSAIVKALDTAVLNDGFDPATKDYWIELEERMAKRLPERMAAYRKGAKDEVEDDEHEEPQRRNGSGKQQNGGSKSKGPRMSSGSQNRGTGRQFLLSAERKQALIEAGVWDDPELRDKYIASFVQYDKDHPQQRSDR